MIPKRVDVVCMALGDRYPDVYITRLENMLRRHMPVPFALTCVTDRVRKLPGSIATIDCSRWSMGREGMRITTNKLRLFDPEPWPFAEYLYLDSTLVIHNDMGPLLDFAFDRPEELVVLRDWNYDCYNTCVMRIRPGGRLRAVYDAYLAGETFPHRNAGDQDYVHAAIHAKGLTDAVAIFPPGMVASYRNARTLARTDPVAAHEMLDRGIIVKYFGIPKMHQVANPIWRWKRGRHDPQERADLRFWLQELKAKWR